MLYDSLLEYGNNYIIISTNNFFFCKALNVIINIVVYSIFSIDIFTENFKQYVVFKLQLVGGAVVDLLCIYNK